MGHFYFLLGLGALLLLSFGFGLRRRLGRRQRLPYVTEPTLFSPAQRAFLSVLERAVGKEFQIYGKVRVADVVGVRPHLDRHSRRRALDRLWDRRFDFLVCRAATGAIACAVNLAPRSRLGLRPSRDGLDAICNAAGLPLVRFREGDLYSVVEIEEQVFAAMHASPAHLKDQEPPAEETRQALEGLGQAIERERSQVQGRRWRFPLRPARRPAPRPKAKGGAVPQAVELPRLDPTMAGEIGEADDGPAFSIPAEMDLGDDGKRTRPGSV